MWRLLRPDSQSVLKDEKAKKSLSRYFSVMQNERPAKFLIARKIPAAFNEEDSTELLWQHHKKLTKEFATAEKRIDKGEDKLEDRPDPAKSYLDLKVKIATRMLTGCHFCVRRCGINRTEGERGYCKCGSDIVVSSIFEHMGEEPELVPSGTIFTMGCTMRCLHCQNWTISQWAEEGMTYRHEEIAEEVERLRAGGCRNANLVGGEPAPWLQQWLKAFKYVNANVPVVWNSNSYYSPETASLLAGFADVYLLDFKYGPSSCAARISDAPNYWQTSTYNHLEAKRYGETIIRLLVLPSHLECCIRPITRWIADNLGKETRVNLMFQYRPEWRASEIPELRQSLTKSEIDRAIHIAKTDLKNLVK